MRHAPYPAKRHCRHRLHPGILLLAADMDSPVRRYLDTSNQIAPARNKRVGIILAHPRHPRHYSMRHVRTQRKGGARGGAWAVVPASILLLVRLQPPQDLGQLPLGLLYRTRRQRGTKDSNTKESKSSKSEPQKIRNELTEEQKREIKEAFATFEDTGIEADELKSAMQALGFDAKNPDVQKILDKLDRYKKPLSYEEYMDVMIDKDENKDPELEMKKAFKVLCEEGTDKITLKSLSKICADLGEKISDEELQEMINEADKDQDEEVGEEDFIKIMQKTGMF